MDGSERLPILDPEYNAALALALASGVRPADPLTMPLAEARMQAEEWHAYWRGELPVMTRVLDEVLATPDGPVPLRFYHPNRRRNVPVAVYFHGGGFCLNSLSTHERLMRDLAAKSEIAVCGVGYGLAPEQRFPAQIKQAAATVRWLIRRAPCLGIRGDRIALCGDSAGANLALAVACALRGAAGPRIAFLLLFYGMYAIDFETESHLRFGSGRYGLSTRRMQWFWGNYLGDARHRFNPLAQPLIAEHEGLPPTLLIAAGLDPLRDDTLRLAQRLGAAGVPYALSLYDDLPHSFAITAPRVARAAAAVNEAAEALRNLWRDRPFLRWPNEHQRGRATYNRLGLALRLAGAAMEGERSSG